MRDALTPLTGWRVAATAAALDTAPWPEDALLVRIAPDEALVLTAASALDVDALGDPHAIVIRDRSWHGVWMSAAEARDLIARHADWAAPDDRPACTQGLIAGIPAKVWFGQERVLVAVAAPYASTFAARLG